MAIDLRSDTATTPTDTMRRAMAEAEVGDDVFGEDPTVNALQEEVAELLGQDAALFVPSGVMGNQLALKLHTQPGDEVILDADSHIYNHESGAPGVISGVQLRPLTSEDGFLESDTVAGAVRAVADWEPRSRLLCLEQTVNQAGGRIYPLPRLRALLETARTHDLRTHLDGARLWNASAATGIDPATYADGFDTVSVCLSKGLGAPIGSVLAGSAERIDRARRYRKMMGGGMRQVGIIAAGGRHALWHHRKDLERDHRHARILAETIEGSTTLHVDLSRVETNIVLAETDEPAEAVVDRLREEGLLVVPFGPRTVRLTTHRDLTRSEIERTADILESTYGTP